jgi:hypothetical protein
MTRVISEDATRRALKAMDEEAGIAWLDNQLHASTVSALSLGSWILDILNAARAHGVDIVEQACRKALSVKLSRMEKSSHLTKRHPRN